mmetsp:Transcript_4432/g.6537  ORF Transcript_4432/g.6537 Transcript_4432/m.6537 type:complete len:80 (-) Transcript_4432:2458-2697(-)
MSSDFSVIKDISFSLEGPKKVAIIGKVGSGKSTLLATIMKEAMVKSGSVEVVSGKNAVCISEQNPVIVSGTIRSNILFG